MRAPRCRPLCIPAGIMNYIFLFQPSIDYNIFYYLYKKQKREREREKEIGESVDTTYKPSFFLFLLRVLSVYLLTFKKGTMKKGVKKGFWCDLHINNQGGSSFFLACSLFLSTWMSFAYTLTN